MYLITRNLTEVFADPPPVKEMENQFPSWMIGVIVVAVAVASVLAYLICQNFQTFTSCCHDLFDCCRDRHNAKDAGRSKAY